MVHSTSDKKGMVKNEKRSKSKIFIRVCVYAHMFALCLEQCRCICKRG